MEETLNLNISNRKELGEFLINALVLEMRAEACERAYYALKAECLEVKGGCNFYACKLSDVNERSKYQKNFEIRISAQFQDITDRVVNSILHPYKGPLKDHI